MFVAIRGCRVNVVRAVCINASSPYSSQTGGIQGLYEHSEYDYKKGSPNSLLRHFSMKQHQRSAEELVGQDKTYNSALQTWLQQFRPQMLTGSSNYGSLLSDQDFLVTAAKLVERVYLHGSIRRSGLEIGKERKDNSGNLLLCIEASARHTQVQGTYSVHKTGGRRTAYNTRKNQTSRLTTKDGLVHREDVMNPRLTVFLPHVLHHTVLENQAIAQRPHTIGELEQNEKYGEAKAQKITVFSKPLAQLAIGLPQSAPEESNNHYLSPCTTTVPAVHSQIKVQRGNFIFSKDEPLPSTASSGVLVQGQPISSQQCLQRLVLQHEQLHAQQHIYAPATWNSLLSASRPCVDVLKGHTARKSEDTNWRQNYNRNMSSSEIQGNVQSVRDPVQTSALQRRTMSTNDDDDIALINTALGGVTNVRKKKKSDSTCQVGTQVKFSKTWLGTTKNGHSAFFALYAVALFGHKSYTYQQHRNEKKKTMTM